MNRWLLGALGMLAIACTCLQRPLAFGQIAEQTESKQPKVVLEIDPALAAKLASPRHTLRSFITHVNNDEIDEAAECLDLTELFESIALEEAKRIRSRDIVLKLKNSIIDKMLRIEYDEVPDDPDYPSEFNFAQLGHGFEDAELSDVMLLRIVRGHDKLWRFSSETIAEVDGLYERWKDRPKVGGLTITNFSEDDVWTRISRFGERNGTIFLVLIILVGFVLDRVVCWTLNFATRLWLHLRKGDRDWQKHKRVWRPIGLLVQTVVWYFGATILLKENVVLLSVGLGLLKAFAVVSAVWSVVSLVELLARFWARGAKLTSSKYDDLLVPLVTQSLKLVAICAGLVTLAQTFGVPLTGLLGTLGIGAMALALASQDAVSNFFGTLTVLVDRPFEVGDWILTEDIEGTVERVGFRSTRVRTFYNSLITLPNSRLTTAIVDNMGRRHYRRIRATLGLEYGTTPTQVEAFCEGVRELIRRHPHTRKDNYHVYLNGFGENSLDVMLYFFVKCDDWSIELNDKHDLFLDIVRLAEELSVAFAFPTRTVHLFQEQPGNVPDRFEDPGETGRRAVENLHSQSPPAQDGLLSPKKRNGGESP